MSAWDAEIPAMRQRLTDHINANPDQAQGAEKRIKPGTEAAKLSAAIHERVREENPYRPDYESERAEFHRHDEKVQAWKAANVEARLAELDPDHEAAIEKIRAGAESLLRGCEAARVVREEVRGIVSDTPRLNGSDYTADDRVERWYAIAHEILETEIARPDLSYSARAKVVA